MILDYLHYQEFNNAVVGAEINCSSSSRKPQSHTWKDCRQNEKSSFFTKKGFLRNEKTTKSTLLWQSFYGNGANYKTCLGFSRQLLGNVLVCMEKEELGWRIISDKREELSMLRTRSQCECL